MDAFCEQVVKRDNKAKQKIISIMLIFLFAFIEVFFMLLYFVSWDPFWMMFVLIIGIAAAFILAKVLPKINKVEFDYSVVSNNFYVDKVLDRKKRKSFIRLEINTITDMDVIGKDNLPRVKFAKIRDCSKGKLEGSYYCVYHEAGRGECMMIFSPSEKILNGMRPHLTRELVTKLFLNRK